MILAIDQGTTGTTCLVFNAEGAVAGRAYSEFQQFFPRPGWVEHDANEIWEVTRRVATEAIADAGVEGAELEAIGITNQRETVVAWDPESGEPIHRALVWQDRRTAGRCDELRAAGHEPLVRERTGLTIDPYFSGTKIEWLQRNAEGAERAVFGTVDSWLLFKLTGQHLTDYTNASRTMLFDIRTLAWDAEICDLLGVDPARLPRACPSSGVFGTTNEFGGEVPVAGVAGDQQAALFGQACHRPGMAKNTYGTGSFVLMNVGAACPPPVEGLLTTIAWTLADGTVAYALEGSIFSTGSAIQWLRDGLGVIGEAAEIGPLAASVEDSGGVFLVPAFTGLGSPWWDPYARGTVVGITRGTSRAHLARAVIESMAFQTRDAVDAMVRASGQPLRELRVDGGASVMDGLLQVQADQLGATVQRPREPETTAIGAAHLAALAEGVLPDLAAVAASWQLDATFEPNPERATADGAHATWLRAVERSRAWES